MSKKKMNEKTFCGVITREQQIKAMKARSTDYNMPKGGFYMTEKDRPRKKYWKKWVD